jgi:hypothetical protein
VPAYPLASQISPRLPDWLWRDYLPLGALVVLTGDPGHGKSLLTIDLAARVSTGARMPDGSATVRGGGGVVLVSHEDDIASVVVPRLASAGADLGRVIPMADLVVPDDLSKIDAAVRSVAARLVVLDPATSVLASTHKRVLDRLNRFARTHDCTILLVRHARKAGGKTLHAGAGAMTITGAARAEYAIFPAPDDPATLVMASVKYNFGKAPDPYSFGVLPMLGSPPRIHWIGPSPHDAAALSMSVHDRPAIDEAIDFLHEMLAGGPVDVPTIKRHAAQAGLSWRTLQRARRDLLRWPSKKGPDAWYWSTP